MSDALDHACEQSQAWFANQFQLAHAHVRAWDLPQWKGTEMPRYMTCPVGAVLIGDVWMQAGDEVVITEEPEVFDDNGTERVRIRGRISQGWGKGRKIRSWVWPPEQTLEIRR